MYMRMLLLSLGFPTRNHFERAAQQAMRRFHRLLLGPIALLFLLSVSIALIFEASLVGILYTIILLFSFCAGAEIAYRGKRYCIEKFLRTNVYHHDFSEEVAGLCRRIKTREVATFLGLSESINAEAVPFRIGWRIAISKRAAIALSRIERRGLLAHELGHPLLPLGDAAHEFMIDFCFRFFDTLSGWCIKRRKGMERVSSFLARVFAEMGSARIMHAREFAADAIGACILCDARPVAFCLQKLWKEEVMLGLTLWGHTHPPTPTRINRLLDTQFVTRHAR